MMFNKCCILFAAFLFCQIVPVQAVDKELQDSIVAGLAELIADHQGEVAIAFQVTDADGQVLAKWDHQGQRVMPTASLIKLPVMVEAYRQIEAGKLASEKMLTLAESDKVPGSGVLTDHFSAGVKLPLRDAIRLMIRYSDNTATNLVLDQIGLASTRDTMKQLGFPQTQIHAKVFRRDTSIDIERSQRYGLGSTTAHDMVEILLKLDSGEMANDASTAAMLEHLLACEDDTKLARFLPSGAKIAHKTGAVTRSRTDAGIISVGDRKIYVCVLTDENKDHRWTDDNAAEIFCGRVGKVLCEAADPDNEPQHGKDLKQGAFGRIVEDLQRTLNDKIAAELSVDGDFGPATEAAVRKFQRSAKLPENGIVNEATWNALGTLITEDEAVPAPEVVNAMEIDRQSYSAGAEMPPEVTAKAWAILDAHNGNLLAESVGSKPLPMASTTKLMTAHVVLELAKKDPHILEEVVTFSERADQTIGSTSGVRAGEQLTVHELLYGLLLPSGNDASVALAEHFGARLGDAPDADVGPRKAYRLFVDAMNREAKQLGMDNSQFVNPHGLTEEGHYTSANDLGRLAYVALQNDRMRTYVGTVQRGCRLKSVHGYSRDVVWKNTNRLLNYSEFSGVKTGTTSAAGACLVALGEREQEQRIVVILGSASSSARYVDAKNLFRWTWSPSQLKSREPVSTSP